MEWLILLALVALVALVLLTKTRGNTNEFTYEKNEPLFSPAERSFFGVLTQAAKDDAIVFGKVRVADVLRPQKGMDRSNWQKAFNRISAKHFDYVICSPDTLSVFAVIELDDKSHSKSKRAKRDRFLETACSGAGLPLHRFKAAVTYNITDVRNVLFPVAEELAEESVLPEVRDPKDKEEQVCPKCSSPLVKKMAKKGTHKGTEFLACSSFPKCRYVAKSNAL
jgi:very-short-patch-repair endonuclease